MAGKRITRIIDRIVTEIEDEQDDAVPDVLTDGQKLHSLVPPEMWCITRQDLRHFRRVVKRAVRERQIVPTASDPFDPTDFQVGPNIYTVTEQFIKPVTAKRGNASWALMLHPEGLPCDVFITHAWREGTFEFTEKVLASWPRRARHAYCCMLANPQNLDIGTLIANPRDSPFAQALAKAKYMMVVPNQQESVYCRLWCVYEAYLASALGKTILTARRRVRREVLVSALIMAPVYLLGHLLALAKGWQRRPSLLPALFWFCILILSQAVGAGRVKLAFNMLGTFTAAAGARAWIRAILAGSHYTATAKSVQVFLVLMLSLTFCFAEVDRIFTLEARQQKRLLSVGFTGRAQDASCSDPGDAERITKEIDGRWTEIDEAVNTLLLAGTSSPGLREAAKNGIDVTDAGRVSVVQVVTALCLWAFFIVECGSESWESEEGAWKPLFMLSDIVLVLLWCTTALVQVNDRRSFAASALSLIFVGALAEVSSEHETELTHQTIFTGLSALAVICSMAGPGRLSRCCCVGPWLAQLFLTRGLFHRCLRHAKLLARATTMIRETTAAAGERLSKIRDRSSMDGGARRSSAEGLGGVELVPLTELPAP